MKQTHQSVFIPDKSAQIFIELPDGDMILKPLILSPNLEEMALEVLEHEMKNEVQNGENVIGKAKQRHDELLNAPIACIKLYLEMQIKTLTDFYIHEHLETETETEKSLSDKSENPYHMARTYLLSTVPSYLDAINNLYQQTTGKNNAVNLFRAYQCEGELHKIETLFDKLHERNLSLNLIPTAIKLITIFNAKRMPCTHIVTVSQERLVKQTGIAKSKMTPTIDWFIERGFIKKESDNLILNDDFFTSFYASSPLSIYHVKNFSGQKKFDEFKRELFAISNEYSVKEHDENELKLRKVRNAAHKTLQSRLDNLNAAEKSGVDSSDHVFKKQNEVTLLLRKLVSFSFGVR